MKKSTSSCKLKAGALYQYVDSRSGPITLWDVNPVTLSAVEIANLIYKDISCYNSNISKCQNIYLKCGDVFNLINWADDKNITFPGMVFKIWYQGDICFCRVPYGIWDNNGIILVNNQSDLWT